MTEPIFGISNTTFIEMWPVYQNLFKTRQSFFISMP